MTLNGTVLLSAFTLQPLSRLRALALPARGTIVGGWLHRTYGSSIISSTRRSRDDQRQPPLSRSSLVVRPFSSSQPSLCTEGEHTVRHGFPSRPAARSVRTSSERRHTPGPASEKLKTVDGSHIPRRDVGRVERPKRKRQAPDVSSSSS